MKNKIPALSLLACLALSSASPDKTDEQNMIHIQVNTREVYQTIHNFGASDAWSGQFIGNWPDNQRNEIADLLFSTHVNDAGKPEGIGLSCWRFNIGAGSAAQGDASNIGDEWRRAPGFLNKDGSYDWEAQQAQRWLMRAAKERGCNQFIGFVNSPPVEYTKNGKAYSDDGQSGNLPVEKYDDYARFLVNVVSNIKELDDIEFDYISPFNEPEWDWKADENGMAGQEGSPWWNDEIKRICHEISKELSENQLNTQIEIPESAQFNFLYETHDKPGRSNHIEDFFSPSSPNYVGNLPGMAHKIAGHSYFTTWDDQKMMDTRQKVAEKIAEVNPDLEFWMSEYCILEDNEAIKGPGKDLTMKPALYMAQVMHADLATAQANAWHWWLAVSPYDYKDGLVYIDKNKTGSNIEPSKMLWAMGNFSRFITPGSKRTGVSSENNLRKDRTNKLMVSSYITPEGNSVCVLINDNEAGYKVKTHFDTKQYKKVKGYITSNKESHNLQPVNINQVDDLISIPGKSIVTLVYQ